MTKSEIYLKPYTFILLDTNNVDITQIIYFTGIYKLEDSIRNYIYNFKYKHL